MSAFNFMHLSINRLLSLDEWSTMRWHTVDQDIFVQLISILYSNCFWSYTGKSLLSLRGFLAHQASELPSGIIQVSFAPNNSLGQSFYNLWFLYLLTITINLSNLHCRHLEEKRYKNQWYENSRWWSEERNEKREKKAGAGSRYNTKAENQHYRCWFADTYFQCTVQHGQSMSLWPVS